jgi:hypothetical protein
MPPRQGVLDRTQPVERGVDFLGVDLAQPKRQTEGVEVKFGLREVVDVQIIRFRQKPRTRRSQSAKLIEQKAKLQSAQLGAAFRGR